MVTPEGKLKKDIKRLLDARKPKLWYVMPVQGGWGPQGVPDFLIVYKGHFFAVECKAAGGKVTALQVGTLSAIREAGAQAALIYPHNVYELEAHLNMIDTL